MNMKAIKKALQAIYEAGDEVFAVQGDADRYHVECARKIYGDRVECAIDMNGDEAMRGYPQDNEGNPLHLLYGDDWVEAVNTADSHNEQLYSSCGHCMRLLYQKPGKQK